MRNDNDRYLVCFDHLTSNGIDLHVRERELLFSAGDLLTEKPGKGMLMSGRPSNKYPHA